MSKFGDMLKDLRELKDVTQDQAANEIQKLCRIFNVDSITRSALSNYENGVREPDFIKLKVLAKYYGVPYETMVSALTGEAEYSQQELKSMMQLEEIHVSYTRVLYSIKHNLLDMEDLVELQMAITESMRKIISEKDESSASAIS